MSRSAFALATVVLSLVAACGRAPALSVDGAARPVTRVDASRSAPNSEGFVDLTLSIFSDPEQSVQDDELTIDLDVRIEDEATLIIGQPIALGEGVALTSWRFGCLCGPEGDASLGTVDGTLTLDAAEGPVLRGVLEATLEGADEQGRDLGTVSVVAPFDVR